MTNQIVETLRNEAKQYRNAVRMVELQKMNGENWNEKLENENIKIISENYFEASKKKLLSERSSQMLKIEDREAKKAFKNESFEISESKY